MTLEPFPPGFFERETPRVARELLGAILVTAVPRGRGSLVVRDHSGDWVGGRVVETEAYTDAEDPGSHSYRGRTPRNFLMFEQPARLYVYFIYGNHYCANIVAHPCDPSGRGDRAGAVLIRALEPLWGQSVMLARRGPGRESQLSNGPGKLCQALGIDRRLNGSEIWTPDLRVGSAPLESLAIGESVRIGLARGKGENLPWRFFLKGNRWVSRGE